MSEIPQWKRDACKWCAAGLSATTDGFREHWDVLNQRKVSCTAPTAEAEIARQKAAAESALQEAWKALAVVKQYSTGFIYGHEGQCLLSIFSVADAALATGPTVEAQEGEV